MDFCLVQFHYTMSRFLINEPAHDMMAFAMHNLSTARDVGVIRDILDCLKEVFSVFKYR